jgi:hypothetical protein
MLPRNSINMFQKDKLKKLLDESNEAFYWVGFILADGWISNNTGLGIETKDEIVLMQFIEFLESEYPLRYKQRNQKDYRRNNFKFNVRDGINVTLLKEKFDIKNNKTYNPPDMKQYFKFTDDQIFSLLCGFIDGDGNIRKIANGGYQLTLENHNSWKPFHHFFEDFLFSRLSYEKSKETYVRSNCRGYSLITVSKRQMIYDLYKKALSLNIPLLKRKWKVLDDLK